MKLENRLALFRPFRILRLLAAASIYTLATVSVIPIPGYWEGSRSFLVALIIGPLFAGRVLTLILHSIWHRPASATIPRLGSLVWNPVLPVMVVTAVVATAISSFRQVPLHPVVGFVIATAMLTLTLPFERGLTWRGQRLPSILLIVGLLGITFYPRPTMDWVSTHQIWVGVIASGLIGISIFVSLDRHRLRVRATQTISTGMSSFDADERTEQLQKFWRGKGSTKSSWSRQQLTTTIASWSRAVRYETWGFEGKVRHLLSKRMYWVSGIWFGWEINRLLRSNGDFTGRMTELHGRLWGIPDHAPSAGIGILWFTLSIFAAAGMPLPSPSRLYPLARQQRARLAIHMAKIQCLWLFGSIFLAVSLLALAVAAITGQSINLTQPPIVWGQLIAGLPLVAITLWLRFRNLREKHGLTLFKLVIAGSLFGGSIFLGAFPTWTLNPMGFTTTAVITITFTTLFVREVQRFYRQSDLANRETTSLFPRHLQYR